MAYEANILLGRISKVHGFKGAITVKLEKTFIENIPDMESVFLEIEGKPVPFFIEESDYPGGDSLKLVFLGYETFEKVNGFAGCRVFLTKTDKKRPGSDILTFSGFKICLPGSLTVGTIREIIVNPGQQLLLVDTPAGKELLIPLHEDFIRSVDKKKKIIIMDLPEGLTDLN